MVLLIWLFCMPNSTIAPFSSAAKSQRTTSINQNCTLHFVKRSKLTFLNARRLHWMHPKHLITTGFCKTIIINGNRRCKSIGYKYQSYWSTTSQMLLNALLMRCDNSQTTKINANAKNPYKNIITNATALLSWRVCKGERKKIVRYALKRRRTEKKRAKFQY